MIEVVVIGKDEGASVDELMRSLPSDWTVHYVADRCSDDTIERLRTYQNADVVDTTPFEWKGRQVSRARNLGYSMCSKDSDVLFLDGDRFPVCGDIERSAAEAKTDVTLYSLEDDIRRRRDLYAEHQYGNVHNGFYTCGAFFKSDALRRIAETQGGKIFDDELGEHWGVEDLYLGDVCHSLGLTARIDTSVLLRGDFLSSPFNIDPSAWSARMEKRNILYGKKNIEI